MVLGFCGLRGGGSKVDLYNFGRLRGGDLAKPVFWHFLLCL